MLTALGIDMKTSQEQLDLLNCSCVVYIDSHSTNSTLLVKSIAFLIKITCPSELKLGAKLTKPKPPHRQFWPTQLLHDTLTVELKASIRGLSLTSSNQPASLQICQFELHQPCLLVPNISPSSDFEIFFSAISKPLLSLFIAASLVLPFSDNGALYMADSSFPDFSLSPLS